MPEASTTTIATLPAAYQAWRASALGRITDRIEEELVVDLIGPLRGMRVLDIGCGDGALAVKLASLGAAVTGIDADPRMLAAARMRVASAQADVTLVEADCHTLPFADETFDIVVAVTVLCFVQDPSLALKEMAKVLRPGGRLLLGELGRHSVWAAKRRMSACLGSRTWRAASFRSPEELRKLLATAKLEPVELRGAVFYPPCNLCARILAPLDRSLGAMTATGAAFLAVVARKPAPFSETGPT